jgi:ABC-type microcin C transport system duplicated ATPase subunit YejF
MQVVFQDPSAVSAHMSVAQIISEGLEVHAS